MAVQIRALDPVSEAGVRAQLRGRPEVDVLPWPSETDADVLVCVLDRVSEENLAFVRSSRGARSTRVVLVLTAVDDADLVSAVEAGVCGIVRRTEATAERLTRVIVGTSRGEGALPGDLLGRLLAQVGQLQSTVLSPRGLHLSGLTDREIDVLRLVAEGLHTSEIARKLSYSERTVKNVLHDVTTRLGLRNRTHAVAYAMRSGLI